ncbi:MAG: peptidase [Roseovarius sp. BRH_c41]|jgi:NlpC/P60 family putative phage cell wall peptidase|uniref:NlpC/P60 family protein n=1 Tax=Roseovarius sp. BRH_c41 TaxID=1629709 RepID=UPI0005F198F2|nr:NlpC/P60 family protein [Roseovarius sp. BRH_c41]KJS41688.1 MAG: peptidase [Roseovarius sp. BRH_c41]
MSEQGARIVAAARGWIGTPYRHQAACRGAGCDCLGLVRGLWREIKGAEPERPPAYSMDWSEPARQEALWQAAARHFLAKDLAQEAVGDVILFRMREGSVAKHLGVVAELGAHASFIHAYSGHGVVETALSAPWRRRIVARFAFPEEG